MAKKIETIFSIQDKFTKTINKIINSSANAEKKINKVSQATDTFNNKMKNLKEPPSDKITRGFDKIKSKADSASNSVGRLIKTIASLATAKMAIDVIDSTTLTNARLNMINDGKQTNEQLQNKIMQSADRSRSSYATTAANVSKLGLLAPDAFGSNDEIIRFSELLNKSFKVGGASTQEQEAGTYQLTQAMAAGKLQGDEFRSVMENAPLVAQAIADYTGKSKGKLKEMSSQGTITADIIKNAMFASADKIENRFKKMPKTFGDYWTMIKNKAIRAFNPIIKKINEIINTPQFEEFFNNLCIGIQVAADAVNLLIDGLGWLYQTLEPFAPIILGIVGALIAYKVYTMLAAVGQTILNIAMSLNPAGLVIAGIVALIAILAYFYVTNEKVAYSILYLWDALIVGAMTLWLGCKTAFYGIVLAGQYLALGWLGFCYILLNAWYGFLNGVEAVGVGILYVFQWLYNGVLGIVNGIINLLNLIPGVSIDTAEYANFADNALAGLKDQVIDRNKDLQKMLDSMNEVNDLINDSKSNFGADLQGSVFDIQAKVNNNKETRDDRVTHRNDWINNIQDKVNGVLDIGNLSNVKSIPVEAVGGDLDSSGKVKIDDEDLQYLKDFAEQEYVNKFTTATLAPNVSIQFGDIHENADAEAIKNRITEILEEEIAEVAEGVYN